MNLDFTNGGSERDQVAQIESEARAALRDGGAWPDGDASSFLAVVVPHLQPLRSANERGAALKTAVAEFRNQRPEEFIPVRMADCKNADEYIEKYGAAVRERDRARRLNNVVSAARKR